MAEKREKERVLEICKDLAKETDKALFADLVFDLGKQLEDVYGKKEPESSPIDGSSGRES